MEDELCSRHAIVLLNYKDAYEHVNPRVEFTKLDKAIILPNKPMPSTMTSMLPEEDSKATKMKQRLMSNGHVKEETRSFLNILRENLSVSHSDLEQGFNRSRQRPSRNMILSVSALMISILCLGLVSWKLSSNAREIEQLKREVDSLKRFLELDISDEIKTLKKLYREASEDSDPDEADIDNADYDSNYEDESSASQDDSDYSRARLTYGSRLGFLKTTTSAPTNSHKIIVENKQENYKNIERELEEEHTPSLNREEKIGDENSTEHKHDDIARRDMSTNTGNIKEGIKLKRSVSDHTTADESLLNTSNYHRADRHSTKAISSVSKMRPYASDESHAINATMLALLEQINATSHSQKKYHTHARLQTFPLIHDDQLSEVITRPNSRTSENPETISGNGRVNWRNAHRNIEEAEIHKSVQNFKVAKKELHRRLTRRHLRAPRQIYATHYGADSALFTAEDEHTGNGRARHSNGIFKAWQPSDWVAEFDMSRYFTLSNDGKLTVHEPGLYLVYAQIHYLDEHDENGFRLLVNDRSILQCMVYSPGRGHKSRSCFSTQVTVLQAGDHVVLKDIGTARYTLFQRDKSFFGLVKLGELRQQQKHQQLNHNN